MRFLPVIFIASLTATQAVAQIVPSAPALTAGPEFKGLSFDWDQVAGATRYEFEYKPNQNSAFAQLGNDLPASATSFRYRFPLHLFDWTYARYRVAACNASGCTHSNEVSVSDLRRDAVGFFKPDQTINGLGFGVDTDVSPDGLNMVAAAPFDAGPTSFDHTGIVFVFRRDANGTWVQRARLQPPTPPVIHTGTNHMRVRISADGDTVVLGMPNTVQTELGEDEVDNRSGEVFVFRFNGKTWTRSRLYTGPNARGSFGQWVGINDAGDLIAVDSGNTAAATIPRNVYIYRNINGTWQPIRAIGTALQTEFCQHGVFTGDGSAVVQSCREGSLGTTTRKYLRIHSGPNWTVREEIPFEMVAQSDAPRFGTIGFAVDDTGSTIAAQIYTDGPDHRTGPVEVQVFKRDGAWSRVAVLTPGAWRGDAQNGWYGVNIAMSGDGSTIAVGDTRDNGFGTGPRAAPLNPTEAERGAVYVYRLRGSWRLANMIKPNTSASDPGSTFGLDMSLSFNGLTLFVGNSRDSSGAVGIGGDWANSDKPGSGAVHLY